MDTPLVDPFLPGKVEIHLLPEHRLALVRLSGEATTAQLSDAMAAVFATNAEAAGFDVVDDLRAHAGHLGVDGIKAVKALRLAAWPERRPAREVLLTHDAGMAYVARFLDMLMPHVTHSIASDPAEALARATGGAVPDAALAWLQRR